ncbi:MAG TPA: aminomethyl-transferring glycine dehydrogenase subunit GcvPA [Chromatiales bacterium]|nr:aminomethyl-transferring glycine dehydrogenase subunit GcvPA [Thiotrichales bacterium]HIP68540.1 aminomethyl-transferring glycine dehydrogenase subunit GcvPA [Chromatiales bacterium]
MPFIPHTEAEIQAMLEVIGVTDIEQLFDEIPAQLRSGELEGIPETASEMQVAREVQAFAEQDSGALNFIGAGAYEHHIPAAVWQLVSRGEFYSAYTPYQAEASQGTLQVIYEYQSMMTGLTGMDVSNASLYDGASSLAEAVLMAVRANRKSKSKKILMPTSVHPAYRATTDAIVRNQKIELVEVAVDPQSGRVDPATLSQWDGEDIAALVIPQPNFFGVLEEVDALTDWAEKNAVLSIAVVNPLTLGLLKSPGEWGNGGVDIVCGDGQPLGAPLSSGGPYYGLLCCKQKHVRQMPGRIVGRTIDADDKPGFVLTLQAREQHIRRSKATSNICTNQGLVVTASTIHMALLGPKGLKEVASHCYANTHQLTDKLKPMGATPLFSGEYFHEVVFDLKQPAEPVLEKMADQGVLGGYALGRDFPELKNAILVCATETKTENDLQQFVDALKRAKN